MQDQEERVREVQSTLKECFQQMRLLQLPSWQDLADFLKRKPCWCRTGDFPRVLVSWTFWPRIAAQQGQFEKARQCWKAALQHEPAHLAYETDIKAVGQAEKAAATKKTIGLSA